MLLADYVQQLDPLEGIVPGSAIWSTIFSALPVVALFYFLVPRRWLAPKAGAMGAITALLVAIFVYRMPLDMAFASFGYGISFGLWHVGWTIVSAMLLYNVTVETGQFTIIRRSVASLSDDPRIQAVLIGFSFGAFLEGTAGGGTPVAICGAILMGLGFHPFLAAIICLIANTSPVAYGGLGTPIIVLGGVTGIPAERLSVMAGHQLPFISMIIPIWMVKCMCSWKDTLAIWPALVVSGGSFAIFQYFFATMHTYFPGVILYPMTDIGGGMFSLLVTGAFLRFWKPSKSWTFGKPRVPAEPVSVEATKAEAASHPQDGHAAEAAAAAEFIKDTMTHSQETTPLTAGTVALAWAPFAIMSVCLILTGLVRQKENERTPVGPGPVEVVNGIYTNYQVPVPAIYKSVYRDSRLLEKKEATHDQILSAVLWSAGSANPLLASGLMVEVLTMKPEVKPEGALFNVAWLTAPGSPVLMAAILSMLMLRMNLSQIGNVIVRTFKQMKIPIPTIALMLGLSYVTRYAGMDATLGFTFAQTGMLYPFFAAMLGWLGVFLTGTDAGSNALFGSLQKITATAVYNAHTSAFGNLDLSQAQVLICTANSTGGVMGKMIDAQSICVATAATNQLGKEADIFKAVLWHSVVLASIVGLMTLLQAYVDPFRSLVPKTPVVVESQQK